LYYKQLTASNKKLINQTTDFCRYMDWYTKQKDQQLQLQQERQKVTPKSYVIKWDIIRRLISLLSLCQGLWKMCLEVVKDPVASA
jgi:hypothetical protein